jgi:isocitrate dehydrogenase
VHQALDKNKEIILNELLAAQGHKVDVGGYYMPEEQLVAEQMRPSKTFNDILKRIN